MFAFTFKYSANDGGKLKYVEILVKSKKNHICLNDETRRFNVLMIPSSQEAQKHDTNN